MDKFEIVPYEIQHGNDMIEFGLNDKLMDYDASFEENRIDFAVPGLSFTLLHNNLPICSGGIYPLWNGVAAEEGAVLSKDNPYNIHLRLHKFFSGMPSGVVPMPKMTKNISKVETNKPESNEEKNISDFFGTS